MNDSMIHRYFTKWFLEKFCREPNLEIDMDNKLYLSFLAGVSVVKTEEFYGH